ncbi:Glycoside-hydrolase family GH114 [Desulfovibrio gilichinskyi]|uniref:Glycoside-hydrolase family GH114 n=1 Tax=Desulfovibrio gilichinskyi TaxID=1519643 RepID=A0A1X7D5A8_9BACT|nr:Glycoside-hydrolase family GH114 [Desulfovibrio gilichinskyi]
MALISFSLLSSTFAFGKSKNEVSTWCCYYGQQDKTEDLARFDLAVLDAGGQKPEQLRKRRVKCLVYVSLGEVHTDSPYYAQAAKLGLLVRYNENWDSWVVDIRRPEWKKMLFEQIIPDALKSGYDGLFFDTLDSPIDMQRQDPDTYKGTERSCVELIKDIRNHYPKLFLCQNRGFEIIQRTAPYIDYLLIEGLSSSMDIATGIRSDVSDQDREFLITKAQSAIKKNRNLVVLSLDYALPDDKQEIDKAYKFSRKQGFVPYVSTPELHQVNTYAPAP